ncbi:MAG: Hsp20/alpha crystallin family protein [Gemmatimonadota bacterium]|nr:MAG: Hsp20/alpha crystallin family protein [Gemmatimonadota bacterium]
MKESDSSAAGRGALAELKEAVGNLFNQVVGLAPDLGLAKEFPLHELRVEDDGYRVRVELPGLRRDDIEVAVAGRTVSVSGKRPRYRAPEGARMLRSERPSGKFDLSVTLPAEIDPLSVVAQVRDGILDVQLPKQVGPRGRSIKVEEDNGERPASQPEGESGGESPWTQTGPSQSERETQQGGSHE